jgi:hypothetical protein
MWWKYVLQSFSAVALMLFGGLGLVGVGAVFGAWAIADSWGPAAATPGTVVLCVAPLLSGFHMLLYAMMLDIQESNT